MLGYWAGVLTASDAIKDYYYELAASVDQHANAVLGGDRDLTISQEVGSAIYVDGRDEWYWSASEKIINMIFIVIVGERNHIYKSIEVLIDVDS
jgi:hypothetical protein